MSTQSFISSSCVYNSPKLEISPTEMAINKRMDKQMMVYLYVEYYSAIKRNGLLIHITWINIKSTILSERSQIQKMSVLCDSTYMKF